MGIHGNRSFFLTKRLMLNKIYSYGAFLLLKIVKNRYRWEWVGFFFLRLEKLSQGAAKHYLDTIIEIAYSASFY